LAVVVRPEPRKVFLVRALHVDAKRENGRKGRTR
jgi:hypothetical protein